MQRERNAVQSPIEGRPAWCQRGRIYWPQPPRRPPPHAGLGHWCLPHKTCNASPPRHAPTWGMPHDTRLQGYKHPRLGAGNGSDWDHRDSPNVGRGARQHAAHTPKRAGETTQTRPLAERALRQQDTKYEMAGRVRPPPARGDRQRHRGARHAVDRNVGEGTSSSPGHEPRCTPRARS